MTNRLVRVLLACAIAVAPTVLLAQQATGVIAGHAGNQFAPNFTEYSVQVRDLATGKAVLIKPLDRDGRFAFDALALNRKYLVELYLAKTTKLVCTEGPFTLTPGPGAQRGNVTIECGKAPAVLWLLAAAAGTASAVALSTASASR